MNTKTSPDLPPNDRERTEDLSRNGMPLAPPSTPEMPPLRDADPAKLQPVPLDWLGNAKGTP